MHIPSALMHLRLNLLLACCVVVLLAADAPPTPLDEPVTEIADSGSQLDKPEEAAEPEFEEASPLNPEVGETTLLKPQVDELFPPAGSPDPTPYGTANVQYMVTNQMRARLDELGYDSAEIDSLKADRAAAIIARGIARPRKGVPSTWNSPPPRKGVPAAWNSPRPRKGVPAAWNSPRATPMRGLMTRVIRPVKVFAPSNGGAALLGSIIATLAVYAFRMAGDNGKPILPPLARQASTSSDDFVPSDARYWIDRVIDDTISRVKLALKR